MAIITRVEQQKSNKHRFNIYLDHEYAFSVHEDLVVSYRLIKDIEIEAEEIKELLEKEELNKVLQKALKYLGYKQRTKAEMKKYLLNKGYEEIHIDLVLKRLVKENLVNDKEYARQFIHQRKVSNPKGKKMLAFELKNRGISNQDISTSLEDFDEDTEYKLAYELANKRLNRYLKYDWQELQRKLGGYLQRRGFSYSVVKRVLNDIKNDLKDKNTGI